MASFGIGTLVSIFIGLLFIGMILPGLISRLRYQMEQTLRHLLIWFGIISALIIGYAFKAELGFIKDRVLGVLIPGMAVEEGQGKIVITKNAEDNHFALNLLINGEATQFIVDTGASDVVLRYEDAKGLGFDLDDSKFTMTVSTANGTTKVAPIKIAEMQVSSITVKNVTASVSRQGELDINLLGMSFLSRLKSYAVEGDRLTLRQ